MAFGFHAARCPRDILHRRRSSARDAVTRDRRARSAVRLLWPLYTSLAQFFTFSTGSFWAVSTPILKVCLVVVSYSILGYSTLQAAVLLARLSR